MTIFKSAPSESPADEYAKALRRLNHQTWVATIFGLIAALFGAWMIADVMIKAWSQ